MAAAFALTQQPGVHVLEKRLAFFLAQGAPLVGAAAVDGALDLEQRIEASDRNDQNATTLKNVLAMWASSTDAQVCQNFY